ncbi:putative CDK4/6 [Mycena pura]|uniref:non-specific serine/threonine protein kinase n=1 Tax=Mycena pura TaxID=153505 RepID=A0AAD6YTQ7_9AGAR|nr:putative CDK4/6 [Mycena pura]
MSSFLRKARLLVRKASVPRQFPTTGFEIIPSSQLVEEETWEWYKPEEFYPVRIGEVFKSQYQVVGKLGYGANGTAWLCRDLVEHKHVTLKVGTPEALEGELRALRHFGTIKTNHAGSLLVRQMLDDFEIDGKPGVFHGIVHPPLAISVQAFRRMLPERALPVGLLKMVLKHLLLGLDFLHTEAKVIHTDIQESNILLGMNEETAEQDLEKYEQELTSPCARKVDGERVIYTSRPLVRSVYSYGRPVLCDFGEARFGEYDNMVDIQPYQYRAPEVIFDIPWDEKVDIWSVGVMIWDLLGNGNLFRTTGGPENTQDNIYHIANMIALLGSPPKELLERTKGERVWGWFDENGSWRGLAEIPTGNLESTLNQFGGEEKEQFLKFARKMLKWKPEERSSAKELLEDGWLNSA